ncbi:hypothetical protein Tsubulata_045207 [Turnera subulata]|uniref:TF-B3 domain-containing protein n=1 Tax=Turnera subulata TaxID=218843 RepID=A0A9Q0FNE4_9ROSI|nr:hypothetical protein Tsubulata_045207 [Turnera subulata]
MATIRKTFYYNFLHSKAEEEAASARNVPHQVTRTLVEIRDWYPQQQRRIDSNNPWHNRKRIDSNNPWHIRKRITTNEIVSGKLPLSHEETFEHIFRYWTLELANYVVSGNKCFVLLMDYTDDPPQKFQSENIYFKNGANDTYVLGMFAVIRGNPLNPGDEVGLFWDVRTGTFGFKVLRRGTSSV